METIKRNVRDFEANERGMFEHVFGRPLGDDQQLIIQVVAPRKEHDDGEEDPCSTPPGKLPDWCNVYEGLSDQQIAEVEAVILQRADLSRFSE